MGNIDIRKFKNELRSKYRTLRQELSPDKKREKDSSIFTRIISSEYYTKAETVLCFVSTAIEINTHQLIAYSLRNGKRVAVPKCLDERGNMKFFYINRMSDLEKASFSLLEPDVKKCSQVVDFKNSICIVPGFSFDPAGFRLGYGKGYYDRFLSKYSEIKIGICYNNCIAPQLPHGKFDVPVDFLFTEKYVKKIGTANRK